MLLNNGKQTISQTLKIWTKSWIYQDHSFPLYRISNNFIIMLIFIFNQLCSNTTHSNLIMIFSKLYYNQNISMVSAYFMHQQSNEFVLWCTFGFWSRNLQKPLLGFHPILMGINIMITWDFECKIRHSFYKLIELQSMFYW